MAGQSSSDELCLGKTVPVPRARNAHFRVELHFPIDKRAIDAATEPLYCVLTKRAGPFSGSRKRSERETCHFVEYPSLHAVQYSCPWL